MTTATAETEFKPVAGCEACNKNILVRSGHPTVYSFQFRAPFDWGVSFHPQMAYRIAMHRLEEWMREVEAAEALGQTGPDMPPAIRTLYPDQLKAWLDNSALDVSEEHAMQHIPPSAARNAVGLIIDFTAESIPPRYRGLTHDLKFPPTVQTLLIDGNHRAYRHWRENKPMTVYVLSVEEQHLCFGGINIGTDPLWAM